MQPYLVSVKLPDDGGYGVGRRLFGVYIVKAADPQDALDAVDEILRDGYKIAGCLGVAPDSAAAHFKLEPGVPEHFA